MESKRYKATVQWFDEDTEKPLDLATYEFSWGHKQDGAKHHLKKQKWWLLIIVMTVMVKW